MEVTLTAQLGGSDAGNSFRSEIVLLRKALKLFQRWKYSDSIEKVKIFLRISGNIENYKEATGIYNVRLSKKKRFLSGEIVIDKKSWKHKNNSEIQEVLSSNVQELFTAVIDKIEKSNLDIVSEKLKEDLNSIVLKAFVT